MADTDKLVKVGQLDTIVDEIVDKFGETNGRLRKQNSALLGASPLISADGFEKGSITSGANSDYRKASRARSVSIDYCSESTYIYAVTADWVVMVVRYNSSGEYVSETAFASMAHILPGEYYRLLLAKNGTSDSDVFDLDTILSNFGMTNSIKTVGTKADAVSKSLSLDTFTIPASDYAHGTIKEDGTDSEYRKLYRIRTIFPAVYPTDIMVSANSGYQIIVATYEADGTFISIGAWTDSVTIPAGTYFRIMVSTSPETTSGAEIPVETLAGGVVCKSLYATQVTENLENKIIKFDPDINAFETYLFEKGTINGTGDNSTYMLNYRARSKSMFHYGYDMLITSNDGYQFIIATYEEDGTFVSINTWVKSIVIPAGTYFRIMIATQPPTTSGDAIPLATLVGGIGYTGASAKATEETVLDYANDNILLPSYYDTYIAGKAASIQSQAVRHGISFVFITDVHVELNAGKSPALIKYLAGHTNCVPFVICGGDVPMDKVDALSEVNEQANKWITWVNAMHVDRVYQCVGNHDYHGMVLEGDTRVNYGLSQNLVYNYVMGRQMFDVHAPYGEKYYYFDIVPSKTRIVVLDCYDTTQNYPNMLGYDGISESQLAWMAQEAFSGIDGYHVICIAHQPFDTEIGGDATTATAFALIKAFANKTTFASGNVSADYTNDTNEFVMLLTGHTHYDRSHVSDNVLSVVTTSDARYTGVQIDSNRVEGTVSEQAFDVFTIDYDTKTINATRIGYGSDRNFTY